MKTGSIRKIAAAAAAVTMSAVMAASVSAERNPFSYKYFNVKQQDSRGFSLSDGILVKTDENGSYGYTGRVKINGDVKFYDNGIMWTGWRKLSGKWYYFDPVNNGVMAADKAKTALGYYYFDEDGAWNGRLSRSAVYPEDIGFAMSENTAMSDIFGYEINTFDGSLTVPGVYSDDDTRSINISKRDMQIFYDVVMSCKLTEVNADMTGYGIIKRLPPDPDALYMESDDTPQYDSSFTVKGKSFTIKGDYDMFQFYDQNEDVRNFAYFRAFVDRYVKDLPEYTELWEIHEAAIAEYVASQNE